MSIEQILKIIEEAEYNYYGLRKDSSNYELGDTVNNSHQLFQDPVWKNGDCTELLYPYIEDGPYEGLYDAGELDGACSIRVTESNIEEALNSVKNYNGNNIYLIAGDYAEEGNDIDELIIEDAKIVGIVK